MCSVCSRDWKVCETCGVEWRGSRFNKTPQMNYHPRVFPFAKWYKLYGKWLVYCGPDELIYDSFAQHIIQEAQSQAVYSPGMGCK